MLSVIINGFNFCIEIFIANLKKLKYLERKNNIKILFKNQPSISKNRKRENRYISRHILDICIY